MMGYSQKLDIYVRLGRKDAAPAIVTGAKEDVPPRARHTHLPLNCEGQMTTPALDTKPLSSVHL